VALDQVDVDQLDDKGEKKEMSFIDHLEELRWTIFRSLGAVGIITVAIFAFKGFFIDTLVFGPTTKEFVGYKFLCNLSDRVFNSDVLCFDNELTIQNPKIIGQFINHFKMSFLLGFILAFPFIFREVWRFIKPALHKTELKATRGVIFFSWMFFLLGVSFGYMVILPFAIEFLTNYVLNDSITNIYLLNDYAAYITMVTLGAGIMFELPVVVYLLAKMGLVSAKFLRKHRKHALIIIITVGAIITPPDIGTQFLIAVPVYMLFELSILIAAWVRRKESKLDN